MATKRTAAKKVNDKPKTVPKPHKRVTVVDPTTTEAMAEESARIKQLKILLVTSPKGGAGKTGTCRHIAVAAAMSGLRVAIIDLDPQQSLYHWWERRITAGYQPVIAAFQGTMADADDVLKTEFDCDLVIIDTPTSVEEHMPRIRVLADRADLILIPSRREYDDVESVIPWMKAIKERGRLAAFVLNQTKRNTTEMGIAQQRLNAAGLLCPIDVRHLDEISRAFRVGATVVEQSDAKGREDVVGVWNFARNMLGL
jgi:chromosome partitioning protein